jgi:hypothetical protein
MRKIFLPFVAFFVFSFSLFSQTEKSINKSEILNGFKIEPEKITFIILNSGYTEKSSFSLKIDKIKETYEIELIRKKIDSGKMVPEPIEITFSKEELKTKIDFRKNIRIRNIFSSLGFN